MNQTVTQKIRRFDKASVCSPNKETISSLIRRCVVAGDEAALCCQTVSSEDSDGQVNNVQCEDVTHLCCPQVSPGNSGAVMKYGFPSLANIKTRESYVTSYDPRTRTASWVIERLNPSSLSGRSDRKNCDFKEDDR